MVFAQQGDAPGNRPWLLWWIKYLFMFPVILDVGFAVKKI